MIVPVNAPICVQKPLHWYTTRAYSPSNCAAEVGSKEQQGVSAHEPMNHERERDCNDVPLSRLSVRKIIVCVYAYRPRYEMWLTSASNNSHKTVL